MKINVNVTITSTTEDPSVICTTTCGHTENLVDSIPTWLETVEPERQPEGRPIKAYTHSPSASMTIG